MISSLLERRFLCGNLGRTCAAGGRVVELDLHLLQRQVISALYPKNNRNTCMLEVIGRGFQIAFNHNFSPRNLNLQLIFNVIATGGNGAWAPVAL